MATVRRHVIVEEITGYVFGFRIHAGTGVRPLRSISIADKRLNTCHVWLQRDQQAPRLPEHRLQSTCP